MPNYRGVSCSVYKQNMKKKNHSINGRNGRNTRDTREVKSSKKQNSRRKRQDLLPNAEAEKRSSGKRFRKKEKRPKLSPPYIDSPGAGWEEAAQKKKTINSYLEGPKACASAIGIL